MKKILLSIPLLVMGLSANVEETSQVSMGQSFYVGGALSLSSVRESNVDADFFSEKVGQDRLGNILLLAGYNYNQNIGIEGRFSATVSSANFAKVTTFSIFAKPQANLTNELKVYGLLGVGYVDISNNKGSNVDASKTSFQWGLGASYDINNKWGVFIDYTSLADDISGTILNSNKASLDSINIGTTFKF